MYVVSTFRHKTSTAEHSRLSGSALALQAAFADINIHKSRLETDPLLIARVTMVEEKVPKTKEFEARILHLRQEDVYYVR
jgi:hypothetical protein